MSKYSRDLMRKTSGVGTESADKVNYVANMVFSPSLFSPSMIFEAMAKFRSEILSSGLLLLLSCSRSSKNASFQTSPCPCIPEPKRFSKTSNILRALSRSIVLFANAQLRLCPLSCLSVRYIPVSWRGYPLQSELYHLYPGVDAAI